MSTTLDSFFQQALFLTSAAKLSQCPPDEGFEVAFAGRSNSGKSSAINALTFQNKLARTSKTPGRTQLINFFSLSESQRIVDLPGYGFAKVPEKLKIDWQKNMGEYLEKRDCLGGIVVVMDVRHPLKPFDIMMLEWSEHWNMPLHILLSKADKLKKGPANAALFKVQKEVKVYGDQVTAQLFSSTKNTGLEKAHAVLAEWLGYNTP